MEVGRWWSDGVQKSVCFVFNIGTNKRRHGRLMRLNENQTTRHPTDSRKFRYDKPQTLPANTVSLTHCMLYTG